MRPLLLAACCAISLAAADDPKEIVRRAAQFESLNDAVARNYTYLQREDVRTLNGNGSVKSKNVQTWDITRLDGSGYRRLVARNDKPLSPQEEEQERKRLAINAEQRRKETPEQRSQRIAAWERKRREQREHFQEVPAAFDFTLAGEETLNGADVWVIDAVPHRGYKPKSSIASYFPKVKGRMWIAKKDYAWVKVDAETLDTISIGAFLVRLAKGGHLTMEQNLVNGEIWMPKRVTIAAAARVLLVKGYHFDAEYTFTDYKKFQAESRVVGIDEKQ